MATVPPTLEPTTPLSRLLERARRTGRAFAIRSDAGEFTWSWTLAVGFILAVVLVPLAVVVYLALTPSENIWPHLSHTVLPNVLFDTIVLATGVSLIAITIGTAAAWLVTMYRFPGRGWVDYLLVLPLAMPTYIVAYCYVDLLDYAGPVQTSLASIFGWDRPQDSWVPEIRSLPAGIFILASVLYPYVYLTARASFEQQSICALEVARTLGCNAMGVFWKVGLPLARPAIAAGVVLVLMESLNDLGAVQHLGINTFSAAIYATWLQRSNLGGAAQLATVLLVLIAFILWLERRVRRDAKSHHTTGRYRSIPFEQLTGARGYLALALASSPFIIGFAIPVLVLVSYALHNLSDALEAGFLIAAADSLLVASLGAVATVVVGLTVAYARRVSPHPFFNTAFTLSRLGYAAPGTILAIGILFMLAGIDRWIGWQSNLLFGFTTGQIFSGSILAIIVAYVVRFCAVAMANLDAGLQRISPSLDAAARSLGETAFSTFWRVHFPLLLPALGAAALLVFVDAMKELPATLLLRPFDFETLATHVYNLVALEQFEKAALSALAIVLVGVVPVLLLHQAIATGRVGGSGRAWLWLRRLKIQMGSER